MTHTRSTPRSVGRLIVVCGLPGSGKTTTAKRLATERGGIRMCPDEWMAALGIDLFDMPARARIEALQWDLTAELLTHGTTVIIEWGVWSRHERDELRARTAALGVHMELILLDVPLDELWRRIDARQRDGSWRWRPISRDELALWSTWFERPGDDELTG